MPPFSRFGSLEKMAPITVATPISHANGIDNAKPQARRCGFISPNHTQPSAPHVGRHAISGIAMAMKATSSASRMIDPHAHASFALRAASHCSRTIRIHTISPK